MILVQPWVFILVPVTGTCDTRQQYLPSLAFGDNSVTTVRAGLPSFREGWLAWREADSAPEREWQGGPPS